MLAEVTRNYRREAAYQAKGFHEGCYRCAHRNTTRSDTVCFQYSPKVSYYIGVVSNAGNELNQFRIGYIHGCDIVYSRNLGVPFPPFLRDDLFLPLWNGDETSIGQLL